MDIRIEYDVPVDNPKDPNNIWNQLMAARASFVKDIMTPIESTKAYIMTLNKSFLFIRRNDVDSISFTVEDNIMKYTSPIDKADPDYKHGNVYALPQGIIVCGVWIKTPGKPDDSLHLVTANAMTNILRRHITNVEVAAKPHNTDVLINGKKVSGIQSLGNDTGIFQQFGINWEYDEVFLKKYLPTPQFTRETAQHGAGKGITGIQSELNKPYNKASFIAEFTEEIERLLIAESLL